MALGVAVLMATKEISSDQGDINFMLGKISAQLEDVLRRLEQDDGDRKELKARVEDIESKLNKAAGVLVVFTAFVSTAASYVWKKVVG